MVDQVRERTGASYEEAKKALEAANCNVVDAIIAIEKENEVNIDVNEKVRNLTDQVKSAVQSGNVSRIRVVRGDTELLNIPVSAGIVGGVLGLALAPWAVFYAAIAGLIAKYGFSCRFELVEQDGNVREVVPESKAEETPAQNPAEPPENKTEQ